MAMSDRGTRHEKMLYLLGKSQVMTIRQLAQSLQVSEMTIRRDVALLEDARKVKSFYGGVSLSLEDSMSVAQPYVIDTELIERTEIKKRIAKKAASLIEANDVILIDAGSTTSFIVDYIPVGSHHTIYCYSLNILNSVCESDSLSVVFFGGCFHKNTRMFESDEGAALIRKTRINKAFMAARGVTDTVGITTAEPYEINMKRAALSVADQKILLVDSSKFGKVWYAKYAALQDIDIIITDSDLKEKYREMILNNGITIYTV